MSVGVELDCLEGIRVVDFTQFEAGPSCTESLAWLGAEVVKIESPRTGDPGRRLQGAKPDPWYFHQFNANKKSVTLNLKSARGLEIVRGLLKKADVTIENMAPGTIERLGLGYDEVKKINPGIIYCQVKGFGAGSPYEKSLAFDMIAQAAGGTFSVTGEAGRAPVKPGPSLGDTGTGMLMAISILGALYKRSKTGQGRLLQVAMQDAMLHYMRVPFSRTQLSGQAVMRDGSSRSTPGGLTPSALYPVQARRTERLRLRLLQPCQPRALAAPAQGHRPRGSERRRALRHPAGAHPARGRGRRDHRRLDPPAHQGRGDAADRRGRRASGCGVRHAGAAERSFARRARHHADHRPPDDRQGQDAGLAGALRWGAADGQAVAAARPARRRRARLWLGMGAKELAALREEKIV